MGKWLNSGVLLPCVQCQELTPQPVEGRCSECAAERRRMKDRARPTRQRENRSDRHGNSNTRWKRLSVQARKQQRWCSDCHETEAQVTARGDRLEVDHTPSAWAREAQGKAVRLVDVDVVCGSCNRNRGPAQPGSQRYEDWKENEHD